MELKLQWRGEMYQLGHAIKFLNSISELHNIFLINRSSQILPFTTQASLLP